MATRSAVGYYRVCNPLTGEKSHFIGTYVHYDGYQVHQQLHSRFGFDVEAIKEWILEGIEGGGYSDAVSAEPYGDSKNAVDLTATGLDYFWLLDTETGDITCLAIRGSDGVNVPPELWGYEPLPLVASEQE